jgi:hypothetical protein
MMTHLTSINIPTQLQCSFPETIISPIPGRINWGWLAGRKMLPGHPCNFAGGAIWRVHGSRGEDDRSGESHRQNCVPPSARPGPQRHPGGMLYILANLLRVPYQVHFTGLRLPCLLMWAVWHYLMTPLS